MAQYQIKLKPVNAIVGIDIAVSSDDAKTMAIAFRDDAGQVHTLVVDGTLAVYEEIHSKLAREINVVKAFLSR